MSTKSIKGIGIFLVEDFYSDIRRIPLKGIGIFLVEDFYSDIRRIPLK